MRPRAKKNKNHVNRQHRLSLWLRHHRYAIKNATNSLSQGRWTVLINSIILGLSLSLPLALCSVTNHVDIFSNALNVEPHSKYLLALYESVSESRARDLYDQLDSDPSVLEVSYHSREEIFAHVLQTLHVEPTLELVSINPFVHALRIDIDVSGPLNSDGQKLLEDLKSDARIADIQRSESAGVRRETNLIDLFQRFATALSIVVLMSTLLICGYMARNQILRQQLEIEVTRYCGAEAAFIRRPFLYWGAAQGFLGALCAGGIVYVCISLLILPNNNAMAHQELSSVVPIFYLPELLLTVVAGTVLGFLGAWIASKIHLASVTGINSKQSNHA